MRIQEDCRWKGELKRTERSLLFQEGEVGDPGDSQTAANRINIGESKIKLRKEHSRMNSSNFRKKKDCIHRILQSLDLELDKSRKISH